MEKENQMFSWLVSPRESNTAYELNRYSIFTLPEITAVFTTGRSELHFTQTATGVESDLSAGRSVRHHA